MYSLKSQNHWGQLFEKQHTSQDMRFRYLSQLSNKCSGESAQMSRLAGAFDAHIQIEPRRDSNNVAF